MRNSGLGMVRLVLSALVASFVVFRARRGYPGGGAKRSPCQRTPAPASLDLACPQAVAIAKTSGDVVQTVVLGTAYALAPARMATPVPRSTAPMAPMAGSSTGVRIPIAVRVPNRSGLVQPPEMHWPPPPKPPHNVAEWCSDLV